MWDKDQLWQGAAGELEVQISGASFASWIKPCFIDSLSEIDASRLLVELACPTSYHQQTIDQRYYGQIKRVLESQTSKQCELALVVRQRMVEVRQENKEGLFKEEIVEVSDRDQLVSSGLNPKFSFDNFVVGSSNNLAYSASKGVVDSPGLRHNPLFIWGGVGVGKTHLMHAV